MNVMSLKSVRTTYLACNPGTSSNDTVVERSEMSYDEDSNLLQTIQRQRFHDATGIGAINGPGWRQPESAGN